MKTRTLLILAAACGLAIILAGVGLAFRLSTSEAVPPAVALGAEVEVGDMTIVVHGADEVDGVLTVELTVGGVEDPSVADGFRVIASGRPTSLLSDGCGATSVELTDCALAFDVSAADTDSRTLVYQRGDQQERWVLSS